MSLNQVAFMPEPSDYALHIMKTELERLEHIRTNSASPCTAAEFQAMARVMRAVESLKDAVERVETTRAADVQTIAALVAEELAA